MHYCLCQLRIPEFSFPSPFPFPEMSLVSQNPCRLLSLHYCLSGNGLSSSVQWLLCFCSHTGEEITRILRGQVLLAGSHHQGARFVPGDQGYRRQSQTASGLGGLGDPSSIHPLLIPLWTPLAVDMPPFLCIRGSQGLHFFILLLIGSWEKSRDPAHAHC